MGKRRNTIAIVAAAVLAACGDDPADTPDEFVIAFVELRVGTQVARVTSDGENEGMITLPIGDTIGSVVFVNSAGEELDFQEDADRNVIASSGNESIVTWTRLNKENGIIDAIAEGSTVLTFTLSHGDHTDFGPRSIPITVLSGPAASGSGSPRHDPSTSPGRSRPGCPAPADGPRLRCPARPPS